MSGVELEYINQAFSDNYIAPAGPHIDAFEKEFAAKSGFKHAAALASGTAAMHLALRCIGVKRGDTVIAQSLTFIGGVSPIAFQDAEPVFIDSERISWNMDPDLLRLEIRDLMSSGRKPKAVISTDLYGQCCDMDAILEVCDEYAIPLISDSAEAVGAYYKGRFAGKGAAMAVYSFNGNKIITTSGGGMLASDDGELIEQARFLSQQARDKEPFYQHTQIGYNYRLSNVCAAIGRGQLTVLDKRVAAKRRIFEWYKSRLSTISGLDFMPEAPYGKSNRWLTVILLNDNSGLGPEDLRLYLESKNIESRPLWKPMHLQPVFKKAKMRGGGVSEDLFARGLCLPSGSAMDEDDVDSISNEIKSYFH